MAGPSTVCHADGPRYLRRDIVVGVFVFVLWIVPIVEGALNAAPNRAWPTIVRDTCSVSCLFRGRPERFSYFHLQIRRDGRDWQYLREPEFFPMQPFGYRSRFDRFMDRWGTHSPRARDELARWVAARDRALHPEEPAIVAVRFLYRNHEIRPDAPPQGRWQKPDPERVPPHLDSTHPIGEAVGRP